MSVEIAAATLVTAVILSLSSFFKFRPTTKLVSAHGLLLASFFATAAIASIAASFSVHHEVKPLYPMWLAVSGTVILFVGGLIGHVGRQMEKSSRRFSLSNIIFYILAFSTAALFFTATGKLPGRWIFNRSKIHVYARIGYIRRYVKVLHCS